MPQRKPRYEIVVSAENNPYVAWQAMLFHYSCLKHTGHAPLVVVHGDTTERLVAGLQRLERHGGRIQRVPNFRLHRGFDYAPRNTPGTLRCVESDADYLVLCDPDMIFFGPGRFERHRLAEDQITLDRVPYMAVNGETRSYLSAACKRAGVSLKRLAREQLGGGVPHIVPISLQPALSREWFRSLDFFFPVGTASRVRTLTGQPQISWLAGMWALIFAIHRLGLRPVKTQFALSNFDGALTRLPPLDGNPFLIHYCYGDSVFNKREFYGASGACANVWNVRASDESVSGRICREVAAATEFYGLGG